MLTTHNIISPILWVWVSGCHLYRSVSKFLQIFYNTFLLLSYDIEHTFKIICFISLVVLGSMNCYYMTVMLDNGT
jgi:hypothetical protein